MDLVEKCAAPHGNLTMQELVIEQCGHGAAKEQILLNLVLGWPRHVGLMGQHVPAGEWSHSSDSPELFRRRHFSIRAASFGLVAAGTNGIRGIFEGSHLWMTSARLELPLLSII